MRTLSYLNFVLAAVFAACYCYQAVFALVRLLGKRRHYQARKLCRYGVLIAARNEETGTALAREFGQTYRRPSSVSLRMHDLLVNCTPVGMYSDGPYPVSIEALDHGVAVFDMVYGPTPLTRRAEETGCRIAYGADMLAGQGAASIEMWTGVKDSFDTMRKELE